MNLENEQMSELEEKIKYLETVVEKSKTSVNVDFHKELLRTLATAKKHLMAHKEEYDTMKAENARLTEQAQKDQYRIELLKAAIIEERDAKC